MNFRERTTGPEAILTDVWLPRRIRSSLVLSTSRQHCPISRNGRAEGERAHRHNPILQKIVMPGLSDRPRGRTGSAAQRASSHHRPPAAQGVPTSDGPFLRFIRHILGIEILKSFPDKFHARLTSSSARTLLSSRQLEFLDSSDFIIQRERVEKRDLIQAPLRLFIRAGFAVSSARRNQRNPFANPRTGRLMQLNTTLKALIDKLWDRFWSGGISNPLSAIEQITYLLFMKQLDELDLKRQRDAEFTGDTYTPDSQVYFRPTTLRRKLRSTGRAHLTLEPLQADEGRRHAAARPAKGFSLHQGP